MEQKESTKKLFRGIDTQALKKYFGKKITELQEEKRIVQKGIVCWQKLKILLLILMGTQKMQDILTWKLKALEAQILDLKKKQESQVQLLKQKKKVGGS